ncbi:MAG: type II toxin-antitoxin system ParD family antitoxin [Candidatus Kapabacteria bacterium]|jgi:antitoxin ParD1/3/4|nr:type II toxin-antitoxin system ParD family antitoxin [Candidatus Kapabacteria bacterium]
MNQIGTVQLDKQMENSIGRWVSSGLYKNANEVIKAGLKLLEDEEKRVLELRSAIQEGLDSGIAYNFNPEEQLQNLKSNYKTDA